MEKTYETIILDSDGGSRPCPLHITDNGLRISNPGREYFLSYPTLKLSYGGANGKLLYLSHPAYPQLNAYVRDLKILKDLNQYRDQGDLNQELFNLQGDASRRRVVSLGIILAIVLALIFVYFTWSAITLKIAQAVPFSWEQKLGGAIHGSMRSSLKLIESDETRELMNDLAKPLVDILKADGFELELYVSKQTEVNAFALPGGIVVVNSGLILRADRPEEVLGVLGHEFAHISRRHILQSVITIFGVSALVDILLGDVVGTVTIVTQGADLLLRESFSRDHEREADAKGIEYLERAKIDPSGLADLFAKMKEDEEKNSISGILDQALSIVSSHPATDERIQYIRNKIANLPHFPALDKEKFLKLQERLRKSK